MVQRQQRRPRRLVDGILLVDKPAGLSSNAALQRVKRAYQADKAGHTGSLDPLATGLLPICFGEATKLSSFLLDADKHYVARVRLGVATTTGDAEGQVIRETDASAIDRAALEACVPALLGVQQQVPPMYSALKREGRPLYELARVGIEVEREAREVCIHALKLTDFGAAELEFEVRCSKGTYVRTLAEDWAARLGQAAHLIGLRRTRLGELAVEDAWSLESIESLAAAPAELDARLQPMRAAVADWPVWQADAAQLGEFGHGRSVQAEESLAPGRLAILDAAGRLCGLALVERGGRIQPRRWFVRRMLPQA